MGVSNFNTSQMEALFRVPGGDHCATNQVPYSLNNRSIEHDLLSWCKQHDMPVMAYSPLGGGNNLVIRDRIGAAHDCSAAAVALAWVIRNGNVIAIPESGVPAHVKENAVGGISGTFRCKVAGQGTLAALGATTLSFAVKPVSLARFSAVAPYPRIEALYERGIF